MVKVEIPLPAQIGNSWLDKLGWFAEAPTFDDLQAEIVAYRQTIDRDMEPLTE